MLSEEPLAGSVSNQLLEQLESDGFSCGSSGLFQTLLHLDIFFERTQRVFSVHCCQTMHTSFPMHTGDFMFTVLVSHNPL